MFGGHGLYLGTRFFGIVYKDRLYFRTDDSTRSWYERQGMSPFHPNARQHLKTYFEVPGDVLEDKSQFVELANQAAASQPRRERRARTPSPPTQNG